MSNEAKRCECGECAKCDPVTPADIAAENRDWDLELDRRAQRDEPSDDGEE